MAVLFFLMVKLVRRGTELVVQAYTIHDVILTVCPPTKISVESSLSLLDEKVVSYDDELQNCPLILFTITFSSIDPHHSKQPACPQEHHIAID